MADLTSRLRDIIRSAPRPAARELSYEPERGLEARPDPDHVCDVLGAKLLETCAGPCLVIDRRYESDRWHGRVRIGECNVPDDERLQVLDAGLEAPSRRGPVLLLDLETTGLSGGAGTVAFLAGCAWFDLGALQVRQFLLPGFAAERGLLNAVAELVQPAALIVTYNGRAFDVPLMETRWLFHRLESPFADKRHFDMLHPARRLWRRRARADVAADSQEGGCSLGALERALLDVQRVGDVPGWEIPSRYFQFLRTGEPRLLEAVLEHNRLDLVSLAAVVARAVSLVEGGAEVCADEHESLALGKLFDRAGRTSAAEACYRRASIDGDAPVRAEALVRLALRCRREQRHREAVEAWNAILDLRGAEMPVTLARRVALEALAIHHEHRAHDFNAAREFAVAALDADERPRWRHDVRHRLARLDRKLAGTRTQGPSASAPLLRDDLQSE